MHLHVAGRKLNIARIGRGQLEMRDKIDLPPTSEAKVVISIDGQERVLAVALSHGIDSTRQLVEFTKIAVPAGA